MEATTTSNIITTERTVDAKHTTYIYPFYQAKTAALQLKQFTLAQADIKETMAYLMMKSRTL
jgi:hypothetical protein